MTKKFKHKKTGLIAEQSSSIEYLYKVQNNNLPSWAVEDSCDWEPIVEKQWEIQSFIALSNPKDIEKGRIAIRKRVAVGDGDVFISELKGSPIISEIEEAFLDSKYWAIHSVKRLSDGVIFTLGDRIYGKSILCSFKIDEIWNNPDCRTQILFNHLDEGVGIENAVKVPPAIITEDGVNLFEQDKVWISYAKINIFRTDVRGILQSPNHKSGVYKYFDKEENARAHSLMNRQVLSITDVTEVFDTTTHSVQLIDKLKEIVKSRI